MVLSGWVRGESLGRRACSSCLVAALFRVVSAALFCEILSVSADHHFALVTGASSGLGAELCRLFAADKIPVIAVARRGERLRALCEELTAKHGTQNHFVEADLADPEGPNRLLAELQSRGLEVEYLVNNAGIGFQGEYLKLDLQGELRTIDLNIRALAHLCHLFGNLMAKRRKGRILNIGSLAGFQAGPYMSTYFASKAFVLHFSEALHSELSQCGISVTVSCPGPIDTEFGDKSGNKTTRLFQTGVSSAEEVAQASYRAMMGGRRMAVNGIKNNLLVQGLRFIPRGAAIRIAEELNQQVDKKADPANKDK